MQKTAVSQALLMILWPKNKWVKISRKWETWQKKWESFQYSCKRPILAHLFEVA
jgi:hypothetical protein